MDGQEPGVEPAAAPQPARWRWSTDRIVSLSAMVVGVCTLFITLYQTHLIHMLGTGGGPDRVRILAEMLKVFALADVPPAWLMSLGAAGAGKAVLEVEYSSVYGDRWRLRSDRLVPQPQ